MLISLCARWLGCGIAKVVDGLDLAGNSFQQEFGEHFYAEMDNNATLPPGQHWACIQVSDRTQANIIAFESGCGNGAYTSYWWHNKCSLSLHLT